MRLVHSELLVLLDQRETREIKVFKEIRVKVDPLEVVVRREIKEKGLSTLTFAIQTLVPLTMHSVGHIIIGLSATVLTDIN